jgi:hypothetical protein
VKGLAAGCRAVACWLSHFWSSLQAAPSPRDGTMTATEDELRAQIDDLSDLLTSVRLTLAGLDHDAHATAALRRTNLEATLKTVLRELDRATKALDQLPVPVADGLARVKEQVRESRPSQAPRHRFDKAGAEAILSSAGAKSRKPKGR